MIIDIMTKTEVMLSLLKEFKEEIVPLYTNAQKELESVFQKVRRVSHITHFFYPTHRTN